MGRSKSVMITGCAGFIGSHTAERFLDAGYRVVGVDAMTYAARRSNIKECLNNENFTFYEMDICYNTEIKLLVQKYNIDWIINLAAETHVDKSIIDCTAFIRSNIEGVKSLLEVGRELKTKLLHISTDEVYGEIRKGSFREDSPLEPRNPYSATKAASEHLIRAYANTYGIEYKMVRPSNNFGPRQHDEKLLPTVIRNLKSGNKVPVYGDGKQVREWTYVKYTAEAILFVLEHAPVNDVYNVSSGCEMENIEIIKQICSMMGKDFSLSIENIPDRAGHDFRYSVCPDKLNNIGFRMQHDTISQIAHTIEKSYE